MKYCPRCQEKFNDDLAFCDVDGTPLVDSNNSLRDRIGARRAGRGPINATSTLPNGVTALIGILIGIVLCMLVYVAFVMPGLNPDSSPNQDSENTPTRASVPAPPSDMAAAPLPSPSATPEESPSPEESPATSETTPAAAETSSTSVANNGPISTGATRTTEGGRVLITMKDGSSVEADAAWEDADGVWYRCSSLVSFVERSKVLKMSDLSNRSDVTEASKP